jgi:hypothetical protein
MRKIEVLFSIAEYRRVGQTRFFAPIGDCAGCFRSDAGCDPSPHASAANREWGGTSGHSTWRARVAATPTPTLPTLPPAAVGGGSRRTAPDNRWPLRRRWSGEAAWLPNGSNQAEKRSGRNRFHCGRFSDKPSSPQADANLHFPIGSNWVDSGTSVYCPGLFSSHDLKLVGEFTSPGFVLRGGGDFG